MKSGYAGHDSMREKAERAFGSSDCYKSGGKVHHKPVRRNMGGMMGVPENTADSIQQANQILSNAASNGVGLKRGGKAMHGMRHKRADGGSMNAVSKMGDRDFNVGKNAMGFKDGGKMADGGCFKTGVTSRKDHSMHKHEMGGEVKKAIGGVGKIRHGQMTRGGAQIAPRGRHKG